jgi:hypothetical protein
MREQAVGGFGSKPSKKVELAEKPCGIPAFPIWSKPRHSYELRIGLE